MIGVTMCGKSDEAHARIQGIKKAPSGACLPRMGAFAGWLHHPAHAPDHHCQNHCDFHGSIARCKLGRRQCSRRNCISGGRQPVGKRATRVAGGCIVAGIPLHLG
ncbi:hypothetical protein CO666_28030 [Rhizobium chutanense]|uniref:Uncharacterized protein n=1 Tax=Rhizobium chutanense TaxID=2035448 RepID=A0A2A6J520_9HYPH|nr:hypothetical protein CO666_28030 [Rhizobium chutanense]